MTSQQKLAVGAALGIAAVVGVLLATSGTANAAQTTATPVAPGTPLSPSAQALASAIQSAGGYQNSQMSVVQAFEAATPGLNQDAGYPGANVMAALRNAITAAGQQAQYPLVMSIATYPWTAPGQVSGGWTANNVPAAFADGTGAAWNNGTVGS